MAKFSRAFAQFKREMMLERQREGIAAVAPRAAQLAPARETAFPNRRLVKLPFVALKVTLSLTDTKMKVSVTLRHDVSISAIESSLPAVRFR
jgi:DNA invertase Pin-like site-specific DNA recombinase